MPRFTVAIDLPFPRERVWAWHASPGALERLIPPFSGVRIVRPAPSLADGTEVELSVPAGPLRVRWLARHRDVVPGHSFIDDEIHGPFPAWSHRHELTDLTTGCRLTDTVDYQAPPLTGCLVRKQLTSTFAWRHARTREDLARLAAWPQTPLRIALSGASGLLGTALAGFLRSAGHTVLPLVRRNGAGIAWNPTTGVIDAALLRSCDAVIHLAGANIGQRWTPAVKAEILTSRTAGTGLLARTLGEDPGKVRAFVCASGAGRYGDTGDTCADLNSADGSTFLAEVVNAWEAAADPARKAVRTVNLRLGVVLAVDGGALGQMLPPFRAGAGGPIGSGKQWLSWISRDDAVYLFHRAVMDAAMRGPVHAVAGACRQADFAKTLGAHLHRPAFMPLPAFAVRTLFGAMGEECLLGSSRVTVTPDHRFAQATLAEVFQSELG